MPVTLQHGDIEVLNSVLGKIPLDKAFSIYDLHAIEILKPRFRKEDGAVDLAAYSESKKGYNSSGVYARLTELLISKALAVEKGKHGVNTLIELTIEGAYLCAYGDWMKYIIAPNSIKESDILEHLPKVLSKVSPHAEFSFPDEVPKPAVLHIGAEGEEFSLEQIAKLTSKDATNKSVREAHRGSVLTEKTVQYLIDKGFVTNRHDIIRDARLYRQLTDTGRELKKYGSIAAYNNHLFSLEKKETQERRKTRTLGVLAVFVSLAALMQGIGAVPSVLEFYQEHMFDWQLCAYFATGLIVGVLITRLSLLLKNKSR